MISWHKKLLLENTMDISNEMLHIRLCLSNRIVEYANLYENHTPYRKFSKIEWILNREVQKLHLRAVTKADATFELS